jgi:KipI family sensor histidine kinase inhibitor
MTAQFRSCGDTAIVVQFGDAIDRHLSEKVLALDAVLSEAAVPGITETVPTFRSLMVHYDPLETTAAQLRRTIEPLLGRGGGSRPDTRLWRLPVCYDACYAPDLEAVARRTGLTPEEVVSLHCGEVYHVYMIGFLPGYPYMGDLSPELVLPRREDPRVRVPAGSVAIATTLTAIYPVESPGGWHLIGATPVRLFDPHQSPPALLAPGDLMALEAIDRDAFEDIGRAVAAGSYTLHCENTQL